MSLLEAEPTSTVIAGGVEASPDIQPELSDRAYEVSIMPSTDETVLIGLADAVPRVKTALSAARRCRMRMYGQMGPMFW